MLIEDVLGKAEGKTLEFKESLKSLKNIVKSVVAFANTSGGTIVIGVTDKEREVVGVEDILKEEERIANAIADTVEPLMMPDIEIHTFRDRELLVLQIPHLVGPYYLKASGEEKGVFVRFGPTNRQADNEMLESLRLISKNMSYDELPCIGATKSSFNEEVLLKVCGQLKLPKNTKTLRALGLISQSSSQPTIGGIFLLGSRRNDFFPDSAVQCVCFSGEDRNKIIDRKEFYTDLITSVDEVISFIERHTSVEGEIGRIERKDISLYPSAVIREATINAIVHADYSLRGSSVQVAVFSNRIEVTNPGSLPFGQTLDLAMAGISKMRNRIIGRVFHRLRFIDKLGSGLQRIISTYKQMDCQMPVFEEMGNHFRVTLFSSGVAAKPTEQWQQQLVNELSKNRKMGTKQIAKLWSVTDRTARTRLNKMLEARMIIRIATSQKDPHAHFVLPYSS